MKAIAAGRRGRRLFDTEAKHSADEIGNTGVFVVSSANLIGFMELACHDAIVDCCEPGEVTIGVEFDMVHLAPAAIGCRVEAQAEVTAVKGNKADFEVTAHDGGRLLMQGRHRRAVIVLDAFLAHTGLAPAINDTRDNEPCP